MHQDWKSNWIDIEREEMPAQFEADPDHVFAMAFGLSINQKKIKKMEKEYKTMKSKENEDEVEIRVSKWWKF